MRQTFETSMPLGVPWKSRTGTDQRGFSPRVISCIGGFAMATAPAIVRLVGGSVPDALATTRRMHEITLGENPRWSVPVLDFQGTPSGIDVSKVCRTGILPQINTGMAGRVAGTGQVGAGLVTPPAEIFPAALARLAALATSAT